MSASDPGVPLGGAREEAAADAEPTVSVPLGAPAGPAAAAQPLAIPGLPLDRPELHIGAAFVGGLVLARVLKRLAG
ncbi:hypothetical protein Q5424_08520 [Conexibacter sp. JD483]|uniref:hypothetical protein n=1 Tax=unclassified Conexibacter TaxID=2627773 RepID=UPI002725F818|nr:MULTISPECIES: hypothetical protein [unclassified Conexibacter]MDO8186135.1 hypothetical protein [Conexibacter sp. CPCC 205706]MDO8199625.1 hypothetical protein [Conexibacter sp. CPCC 205762]MDR9369121.1 hypothetical protein [Conexibacter sp. JD483]